MELDTSNMCQVIIDSPKQLTAGLELAKNIAVTGNFSNVIICGIGGSALPASLLIDAEALLLPLYIHRDYGLPKQASKDSLIICISYSGNTEEAVSAMQEAIENKFQVVAMATGGIIEKLAKEHEIPFVTLPSGIQPRCATGYMFGALVTMLEQANLVTGLSAQISDTVKNVENLQQATEEQGKALAKKLVGKIPVVYSSEQNASLARIWKIKFNENSKVPAFYNCFPELNHNEMVGYEGITNANAQNIYVVMLQDAADHARVQKRMQLTADVIEKNGATQESIVLKGNSKLDKIFSTLLLGDWTSYYLALEYGIDPTPVKTVEEFKKLMAQ